MEALDFSLLFLFVIVFWIVCFEIGRLLKNFFVTLGENKKKPDKQIPYKFPGRMDW